MRLTPFTHDPVDTATADELLSRYKLRNIQAVSKPNVEQVMNERCCRCHAILASEEKQYFGCSCNECENDLRYEEWDRPVKSAYWRWSAICYCLRVLRHYPGKLTGLLLHRLRGNADA